jgi:hypothetical protein
MTVLDMLESTTYEELKQWVDNKYGKFDLGTLKNMGVTVPTVDDLWEYRNKTIKGLRRKL